MGMACRQCAELCKQCNCGPLKDGCNYLSTCCTTFTEKPLCSFVIITYLMAGGQLYCSFAGLDADGIKNPNAKPKCDFTSRDAFVGPTSWLYGQMGFALLSLLFAPYFQMKVWSAIVTKINSPDFVLPPEEQAKIGTDKKPRVPKKEITEAFKKVFMEDFGVLFYFFAIIAQLFWSQKGHSWLNANANFQEVPVVDPCGLSGNAGLSANLGKAFCFVTFFYTVMWFCGCCAGSLVMPDRNPDGSLGYSNVVQDDKEVGFK